MVSHHLLRGGTHQLQARMTVEQSSPGTEFPERSVRGETSYFVSGVQHHQTHVRLGRRWYLTHEQTRVLDDRVQTATPRSKGTE